MKISAVAFLSCLALPQVALGVLPRAPLMDLSSERDLSLGLLETSSGSAPQNPSKNTPVEDPMTLGSKASDNQQQQQQQQQQPQANGDTAPLPAADAAQATGPGTDAPVDQNALPAAAVKAQAAAQAKAAAEAKAKAEAAAEAKAKADAAAKKAQAAAQAKAKLEAAKKAKAEAERQVKKAEALANAGDNGSAAAAAAAAADADADANASKKDAAASKDSLTAEPVAAPYATHPSFSALSAPSSGSTAMPAWYTMTLMGQAALTGGLSDGHAHSRATHIAHARAAGTDAATNTEVVRMQPRAPLDPGFLQSALMATHLAVRARAKHPGSIPMGIESAQRHELSQMEQMRAWQQQQQQQVPGMFPPAAGAPGPFGNPQMMAGMPPMYGAPAMQQQQFHPQFHPQFQQQQQQEQQQQAFRPQENSRSESEVAERSHAAKNRRHHGFNGMKDSFVSKLEVATKRHAEHEGRVSHLSKDLRSLSSDPEDSF